MLGSFWWCHHTCRVPASATPEAVPERIPWGDSGNSGLRKLSGPEEIQRQYVATEGFDARGGQMKQYLSFIHSFIHSFNVLFTYFLREGRIERERERERENPKQAPHCQHGARQTTSS